MDKNSASMPGVIRVLAEPAAAGSQDGEAIPPALNPFGNPLRVSDYWVDADVANEGLLVTCLEV